MWDYNNNHNSNFVNDMMHKKNLETDGGYHAKVSGDTGELILSSVMRSLSDEYHIMNDVLLQTKKGSTQLDHIIISPYGIFVVETKNHKGMIFGDMQGKVWTQVLNGRGRFTFYSPVLQNNGHMIHLNKQTGIPFQYMTGVIVFTNKDVNLDNVYCPFCFTVDSLYAFIMSYQNRIIGNKNIVKIIERIDKVDTNNYMNRRKHVKYVQKFRR